MNNKDKLFINNQGESYNDYKERTNGSIIDYTNALAEYRGKIINESSNQQEKLRSEKLNFYAHELLHDIEIEEIS